MPLPAGTGNVTNAPLFVNTNGWSNLRLQSNFPCINLGNNAYAPSLPDLDGRPRIAGGTVDMGAYEYQGPGTGEFTAWLQQYGLPTDGSADYTDTDHDGHNNWQEWVAGTDPINALSVLWFASPVITPTNVTLAWASVTNRTYSLEQATNLGGAPAFSVLCRQTCRPARHHELDGNQCAHFESAFLPTAGVALSRSVINRASHHALAVLAMCRARCFWGIVSHGLAGLLPPIVMNSSWLRKPSLLTSKFSQRFAAASASG
jgi:hypothetical protein